jgi:formylglycine-generating enzyme required for sulfatase activity
MFSFHHSESTRFSYRSGCLLALVGVALAACASSAKPESNSLPKSLATTQSPSPHIASDSSETVAPQTQIQATNKQSSKATGPSCNGKQGAGNDCQGVSCCTRIRVPEGTLLASTSPANKSKKTYKIQAFALDKFEATVGRFRAWVAAGLPTPKVGTVLHHDEEGNPILWPAFARIQTASELQGWERYDTWSRGDGRLPKNNISWYTAASFCHWDGGRLPTDAEWQYVAQGGDEHRAYPWGTGAPSAEHAVFNCLGDGDPSCSKEDILRVGSRPKGNGRWGHSDLAGSLFEWTLGSAVAKTNLNSSEKARGGGFCYIGGVDRRAKTGLRASSIFRREPASNRSHMVGVRCAYPIPDSNTSDTPTEKQTHASLP